MDSFDLQKLSIVSQKLKIKGKKIGLCHGVFDVLHAGHISHFEEVIKKCDVLFITVTEDKYVNKGPNRPINKHFFRAKVLNSLKMVDYVGINYSPDAIKSINAIKPDIYFKGKDYKSKSDLTKRLDKEIDAVKKYGGKIIFTESPLKSSTEIINRNFSFIFNSKLQKFLSNKNKKKLYDESIKNLAKIKNIKTLIIGDAIIDQYDTVRPLNKPIKENILATRYIKSEVYLGGVFAAATNLNQFNNDITVCTVLGNDKDLKNKINNFSKKIKSKIFYEKNKVTVRKKRFVDVGYNKKISEVYFMDDDFLSKINQNKIETYLNKNLKKFDVIILIDYGHGLINKQIYNILKKKSKFLAINCQTNSANLGFNLITKYKKADYICIDEPELRLAVSNNRDDINYLVNKNLNTNIKCKNVTVTMGRDGCYSLINGKQQITPALISDKVIDTIGAGDVFLVISSLLYSIKSNQLVTSIIGNIAGALKVDILGHSKSISSTNFYAVLKHLLK